MRLTRNGRAIILAFPVLLAVGLALGVGGLIALAAAALVALAVAVFSVIEAPQVEVSRWAHPTELDRGTPATVTLVFRGAATRPRAFTAIETVAGEPRAAHLPAIESGRELWLDYGIDTSRRGMVVVGPLRLVRTDTLGLLVAERGIGTTLTVAVRPRRHHLRMLPSGRMRDLDGPTRERSEGSASFHQLREYVPGDDLRRIHWRATARTGDLIVKEMVDTTRPELVVVLDNRSRAIGAADFEEAVEVAASVLHAAEADGFPTLLLFSDGSNQPGTDGLPLPSIDRLTTVERTDDDSMEEMARSLRGRGRSLVFVTGEIGGADLHLISSMSRRFSPAYLVSVAAARTAPLVTPPGLVGVTCASAEQFAAEWASLR